MSDPENETKLGKRVPKHTRLRYYSSFEEATIVKLWREHLHEITSYTENLAVFREISYGLQQHRIRLNKQEVRRRISNYRNKYLVERNRTENDPQYKSGWRLFPLVNCLFSQKEMSTVAPTELQVIEQIELNVRKELPNLPHFSRHDCKTMKFEQDPNGCPFLVGQQPAVQVKAEALQATRGHTVHVKTEIIDPDDLEHAEKRYPLMPANRILLPAMDAADGAFALPGTMRRCRRRSIMPRSGQITVAQIEMLRRENDLLAEKRDANLADLELKEREYNQLEQMFDQWLHQQEIWKSYLDGRGVE